MSQPSSENVGGQWTGSPLEKRNVEGCLFPWCPVSQQPILVQMPGCNDFFLPLFSTQEKLDAHMLYLYEHGGLKMPITVRELALADTPVLEILSHLFTIKQVQAGGQIEFLSSIFEAGVRIMLDPYRTERNTTKWTEIVFDGDEYKIMGADEPNIVDKEPK